MTDISDMLQTFSQMMSVNFEDIRPTFHITDTVNEVPIRLSVNPEGHFTITNITTNKSIDYVGFIGIHHKFDMKALLDFVHVPYDPDISKSDIQDLYKRTWGPIYRKVYEILTVEKLADFEGIINIWLKKQVPIPTAIQEWQALSGKDKKPAMKRAIKYRTHFAERYLLP